MRLLSTRIAPALAVSGLAVAAGGALALDADRTADPSAAPVAAETVYSAFNGSVTYRSYCSNCHGAGGRGDGFVAETLRERPSDLTRLAARNEGVFPADRVRAVIDGRTEVRSHGRREMPLWGDIFLWPEEDSPERREHVKRKIGELVEYLRSIQQPDTPPAEAD